MTDKQIDFWGHVGENGLNGTQWFKVCKPVIKKSISTSPTKLKTSAKF